MEYDRKMIKKICFITGTRADFGKLKPLIQETCELGFEIQIFVTGMHMMQKYGTTKFEVAQIQNAKTWEYINQKENDPQDLILAKTILGLSDYAQEEKPDLIFIHGDRIEALAASIVCSTNNIKSVHIEGGEVSGTIDEVYRHCCSKMCTAHMVSSKTAKNRLISLGETPSRIFRIGSPELDLHRKESKISMGDVKNRYEIPFNDFGIVIFHPVTTDIIETKNQSKTIFKTLSGSSKNYVVIHPNNDPGSKFIFSEIEKLDKARFRSIPSMRFEYFSVMLKNSACIIGNSSVVVREAPFLGIPSLSIGSRQHNRNSCSSITECKKANSSDILTFITNEWGKKYDQDNQFGDGNSLNVFREIMKSRKLENLPIQKTFYNDRKINIHTLDSSHKSKVLNTFFSTVS
jgi:UDP-N-acetylglucosamine 2-epimerase (hydrolysing)